MNIITFALTTERTLAKLFGGENVHKVAVSPTSKDKNKVFFTVSLKGFKHKGFIFFSDRLSGKDIRNILFAYKRNLFDLIAKEDKHADSTNEKIQPGVHK